MKITKGSTLPFIPASHEDPKNPGSLKRVLVKKDDVQTGHLQMINWAKLPVGKSFQAHYHEDLEEIFILLAGTAELTVDSETVQLVKGDSVCVPARAVHSMKNVSEVDIEFIAVGITAGVGGKTVVVTQ